MASVDKYKLKAHINKLILLLQEQPCEETFGAWIIPWRSERTPGADNHPVF